MELKEAIDILENVMADEVIGTYCLEIQKKVDCYKNCENEDCFLQQAIDRVVEEINKLNKRIEYALDFAVDYDGYYNPETKQGNAEGLAMTIDDMVTVLKGKLKGG